MPEKSGCSVYPTPDILARATLANQHWRCKVRQSLARIGRNQNVRLAIAGGLIGSLLLVFFVLVRGQRDVIVLQVQPIDDPSVVRVYVGGEVVSPGIYTLTRGSRTLDAIEQAGGLLRNADTSGLGLASPLRDADQIIIPARVAATSAPVGFADLSGAAASSPETATSININLATVEELQQLPGVGPVIGQRIVDYRLTNGLFQSVAELAEVDGISDAMVVEYGSLITTGN